MSVIVKNLTKKYGSQLAVNDVSFEIKKGEIIGFLGPNGAGKSTTMKMISGFIDPNSGKVSVCGFDVLENPLEAKAKIGYLPESNPLYYDMYVKEYLNFVAGTYKIKNKKQRIEEIIKLTGLKKESHKFIGQLSKGYKQRVGLAQAMIHDPEVLILDEPTSGLDPNQLTEIRQLIRNIGKEKTVILSTHIMQEVEAMCDRIIIINQGTIVANETVENIHHKENNLQVLKFKVKGNFEENIFKEFDLKSLNNGFYKIISKEKDDLREVVFQKCVKYNLALLHLELEENNLENVFIDLTK